MRSNFNKYIIFCLKVSKAEGILLLAKEALKNGETEEQLQKMMSEFYRLIPHRGTPTEKVNLRLLAKKEDLCQVNLWNIEFSLKYVRGRGLFKSDEKLTLNIEVI